MTVNRCTIIILSFISFALLVAGTALTSNNRPLWPGFLCFGAMLGCVAIAWLVDEECKPARRRAYRRLQRARERACEKHARPADYEEMQVAAFRRQISAWEAERMGENR